MQKHVASPGFLLSIGKSFASLVEKGGRKRDGRFWVTLTTKICQTQMRLIWLRRNSAHKYKRHRHTQRSFHLWSRDSRMKTGWQQCSRDHTFASLQKQSSAIFIAISTQESNTEALQERGNTWWQNNHQHLFPLLEHAYGKRTIKWLLRVKACLP